MAKIIDTIGLPRLLVLQALHDEAARIIEDRERAKSPGSMDGFSSRSYSRYAEKSKILAELSAAEPEYNFINRRVFFGYAHISLPVSLIDTNQFNASYYDQEYGNGAAERAVRQLREKLARDNELEYDFPISIIPAPYNVEDEELATFNGVEKGSPRVPLFDRLKQTMSGRIITSPSSASTSGSQTPVPHTSGRQTPVPPQVVGSSPPFNLASPTGSTGSFSPFSPFSAFSAKNKDGTDSPVKKVFARLTGGSFS